MKRKKILVLFCGGTIIMQRNEEGALVVQEKEAALSALHTLEPRISELAEIDIRYVDNIDSANVTPSHWDRITALVGEHYENYDGFVITHGTDTMAYTASALTFTLQDLGKPVVLTGAQIPGNALESDARFNFINSVRVASMNLAGVYIVFHEKIVLGARSSKASESKLNAFITKNAPDAGEIRVDIRLQKTLPRRHHRPLRILPGFVNDILVITLIPGRNISNLLRILENDETKGFIIRGYSTGNFPYEFLPVLEKAREKKVPVAVTSQCLHGSTFMERYDVGNQALKLGVIQLYDMSIECAVTKFMWALKHFSYREMKEVMQRNFVGEINVAGELYA